MHIAVTGAAGMIGRKLTDRLVADGYLPRLVFAFLDRGVWRSVA